MKIIEQTVRATLPIAEGMEFVHADQVVGKVVSVSSPWSKPMGGPSFMSTMKVKTVVVELETVPKTPFCASALAAWGRRYGVDGFIGGEYIRLFC